VNASIEYGFSRRPATSSDVSKLLELRRKTMNPHLGASGVSLSAEEHAQRVLVHYESAEVLVEEDEIIGLVKVVRSGAIWNLLQLQLSPARQGQGIGTQIVEQLVSEARLAQATLKLSVLKTNPARRLYERLGFVVIEEKADSFEMQLAPNYPIELTSDLASV
jgi:ribosomal protein S18 acetylase RimI-like enzyme